MLWLLLAAAAMHQSASAPATADEAKCFASWTEAAPVVRREGLARIDRLNRLARLKADARIVNSTLCRDGSRYIYKLVVRTAGGPLKTLVVDARRPFDR